MVPDGWKQIRLDHNAKHVTSGSRGWAEYYSVHGDVFVRITNLQRTSIKPNWSNTKHVKLPVGMNEGLRTRLRQGDILLSITADLGIIGYIHDEPDVPHYINQHVALVRLDQQEIDPEFVAYTLSSTVMRHAIQRLNDAGAKAGLSLPTIRSIPLKVPPLPEQRKIAEILSTWDRAIENTEALLITAQDQKRALMQALLTGKRRFPEFEGEEWREVKLGDAMSLQSGFAFKSDHFADHGIPIIRITNVESTINMEGSPYYDENPDLERFIVSDGDILISMTGYVGKVGVFVSTEKCPKAYLNQRVGRVVRKCDGPLIGEYLLQLLKTDHFVREVRNLSAGGAQPNVSSRDICAIRFKVPETAEQQKIAEILSIADREIEPLKGICTRLRSEKKALMQQLLTGKRRVAV